MAVFLLTTGHQASRVVNLKDLSSIWVEPLSQLLLEAKPQPPYWVSSFINFDQLSRAWQSCLYHHVNVVLFELTYICILKHLTYSHSITIKTMSFKVSVFHRNVFKYGRHIISGIEIEASWVELNKAKLNWTELIWTRFKTKVSESIIIHHCRHSY